MLFMITTSALAFSAAKSSVAVSAPKSNLPALDTRKSNLLALRGGGVVSTEVLYNIEAGMLMLTGFQGLLVPVNTLEMYGVKAAADAESAWVRVLSGMNLVAAVTLIAAQTGLDTAVTTFAIAWALAITYNVAILEKWGADKGQLIGFIVTLGAVGELSRRGIMPASWAFNIMVPFFLFTGFMIDRLMPQQIMAQFVPDMSGLASTPLVKSLFLNFSFTKLALGLFLLTTKLTGNTGLGLAAMCAGFLVNIAIVLSGPDYAGDKAGLAFWAVLQATLGGLAFMNEK